MTRYSLLLVLTLGLAIPQTGSAQQWELVTPIKTRSKITDLRMVDALHGYCVDNVLRFVMETHNAGTSWGRKPYNLGEGPQALWMFDEQHGIIASEGSRFLYSSDGWNSYTSATLPGFGATSFFFLDDQEGFAASSNGQVLHTTDAGVSWTAQQLGTTSVVFRVFFTDALNGFASVQSGALFRTTDGGTTWTELTLPAETYVRDMHFFTPQVGVAVGYAGITMRTTDGGDSWSTPVSVTTQDLRDIQVQGNTMVACGTLGAMVRSTDQGLTWTAQLVGTRDHYVTRITSSGIGLSGSNGNMYRTTNFGLSWAPVQVGTQHTLLSKVSFGTDQKGATVGWQTSGGFEDGTLRTSDGGRHWTGSYAGGLGIHLRADGAGCAGGSVGANRHTEDYFSTTTSAGAPNVAIRCAWHQGAHSYIVAGGYVNAGFYRTTTNGDQWNYQPAGNIYDLFFPSDLIGYAGGEGGVIYKTVNAGESWNVLTSPLASSIFSVFFLNDTVGWLGAAGSGARTTDGGSTWQVMNDLPSYTMSILFTDADTGYAVGNTGQVVRSVDGGASWNNLIAPPFDAVIGDMAYADGALIAVGRYGDVYRAQTTCPVTALTPTLLTTDGVICTDLEGTYQWYGNNELLPDADGPCYTPTASGFYSVVVTDAFGCASAPSAPYTVISTGIAQFNNSAPVLFPDPVSDVLTVQLPQGSSSTAIEVLSSDGRSVLNTQAQGEQLLLHVAQLPAGVYILRTQAGTQQRVQRFVKQ